MVINAALIYNVKMYLIWCRENVLPTDPIGQEALIMLAAIGFAKITLVHRSIQVEHVGKVILSQS